jgi:hypothetical protein
MSATTSSPNHRTGAKEGTDPFIISLSNASAPPSQKLPMAATFHHVSSKAKATKPFKQLPIPNVNTDPPSSSTGTGRHMPHGSTLLANPGKPSSARLPLLPPPLPPLRSSVGRPGDSSRHEFVKLLTAAHADTSVSRPPPPTPRRSDPQSTPSRPSDIHKILLSNLATPSRLRPATKIEVDRSSTPSSQWKIHTPPAFPVSIPALKEGVDTELTRGLEVSPKKQDGTGDSGASDWKEARIRGVANGRHGLVLYVLRII